MLLTGTPLQNNVDELFSLLNFLEPKQFSSLDVFMSEFGRLETESEVNKLKAVSFVHLFYLHINWFFLVLLHVLKIILKFIFFTKN